MRAAVLVTVLCLISISLASHEDIKKVVKECIKELDVKIGENGRPDNEDADKKCLAKCVGIKLGMLDESGNMNEAKVPEDMKELVKGCAAEVKDDDICKKANAMQKCVMSKIKKD